MAPAKDPLTHIDILTHIIFLRLKSPVCLASQKGISEMPRSLVLCGELNSFIIGVTVWQFPGMSLQGSFSSMLLGSAGYFEVFHLGEDLYLAG